MQNVGSSAMRQDNDHGGAGRTSHPVGISALGGKREPAIADPAIL
jgi:hypothetical protein